ncbi:type II toxin-antitoxin system RelE/ParE family toxin [Vibrio sp. FF145]|uniref:type II toxin-antitoxin system RelE/ParE family toxin n=1 Tax=Vibrio sp. FF145 TaxID=3230013 RepID=UPI00352DF1D3
MAIKSFSHKHLENFFYSGSTKGLNANHADRLGLVLDAIDASHHPHDLNKIFCDKFSEKKGSGKGVYSIVINGNWRVTFQIVDDGAILLDYLDYHGKQIKAK